MDNYATYYWEGILQTGETTHGIIGANSLALAKTELRKQGIMTRKVVKKGNGLFSIYTQRIKPSDITLLTRQLATLIKAGVSLCHAFKIIVSGVKNVRMKKLIQTIHSDVETGVMLTQALSKHPAFFSPLFRNMVHAGEQSGTLDVMLLTIAAYKEKMARIKKKINKAMAYPLAVCLIAILITGGLLTYVIPQFDLLFKSFGAELPTLTRYVISISGFYQTWWPILMSLFTAVIYGSIYAHKHSPVFSRLTYQLLLNLPIIGDIVQKSSISRFTHTLSITYAAGLPLNEALKSVEEVSEPGPYAKAAYKVREGISQGQSIHRAIQNTGLFPDMVIQLISIGEESGALEQMLNKVADIYDEDVDAAVDALSSLLEPVIMTILGLLIGGLVVAMYLPILKLGSIV